MKLPDKDAVLRTLKKLGVAATKRDLIDSFNVTGAAERVAFKKLLKDMEEEGLLVYEGAKAYRVPEGLPNVAVIEITEVDIDGDLFARPSEWDESVQGPAPLIEVMPDKKGHHALKEGDKALARLGKINENLYEAFIMKRVDLPAQRIVGFVRKLKFSYSLSPLDRKAKDDYDIFESDLGGATPGQIVVSELLPARRGALRQRVRVTEVVGDANDPRTISLMALFELNLRHRFPDEVIQSTESMTVPPLGQRTDLRNYPLVTIDGKDARDFDDAVFAEPDTAPENEGGWHLLVAIADVAYYVLPNSPLDKEAFARGNSTYFPDRVLPMLPEKLSNDLCSLRPDGPRATLAVHMWIDKDGKLLRHQFVRGLMQSHARLTYEQVQAAHDGNPDEVTQPLMTQVIEPLYAAWKVLDAARVKRGALDLDIPERKIVVDDDGRMTGVAIREQLDAHRLIEEFMVLANVAAAEALEAKQAACVYRVHDRPTGDKLMAAVNFLDAFGLSLPKTGVTSPAQLNHILDTAKGMKTGFLINEIILRSQAQAVYHPENIGHFGLALMRYAHFTSPIRRYADLLVHRSLIRAYDLGEGGLTDTEAVRLEELAAHISATERNSALAERNSVDRFTAAFLQDKIGAEFPGRIAGVTRFGLFIKLDDTGADGLAPMRSLPQDYYIHDESQHALIGRRSGRVFRLGASVLIRVVEADLLTGGSVFELVNAENGAEVEGYKGKPLSPDLLEAGGYRPDRGGRKGRSFDDKKRGGPRGRSDSSDGYSRRSFHKKDDSQPFRNSDGPARGKAPFSKRDKQDPRPDWKREESRSRDDRPRGDYRPREDRPRDDRPRGDYRPREDRPRDDRPRGDYRPREDRPRDDRPRGDYRPREDRPRDDRPRGDYRPPRDRDWGRGERSSQGRSEYRPKEDGARPYRAGGRTGDRADGPRTSSRNHDDFSRDDRPPRRSRDNDAPSFSRNDGARPRRQDDDRSSYGKPAGPSRSSGKKPFFKSEDKRDGARRETGREGRTDSPERSSFRGKPSTKPRSFSGKPSEKPPRGKK